jgi:hypothetical protein
MNDEGSEQPEVQPAPEPKKLKLIPLDPKVGVQRTAVRPELTSELLSELEQAAQGLEPVTEASDDRYRPGDHLGAGEGAEDREEPV